MGFKGLNLKAFYDSDSDDLLHDFYVPVLGEAIRYERLAGFFSSKVLAAAARGIYKFILNGGEMKLITSAYLQQTDVEAIRRGATQPETVIAESGIREIQEIDEPFIMEHLKALAWLIAKGRLSIKIAIPLDEFGIPKSAGRIEKEGLFHPKVGVFKDRNGDTISFNGSINETARAWMYNRESFHVFKSWMPGDLQHLKGDVDSLERWFEGRILRSKVIEIPESLKSEVIRFAPADIQELNLAAYEQTRVSLQDLRDYQKEAMESWLYQKPTQIPRRKGIHEMATGSGKTWIAIACLQAIDRDPGIERLLTVIAVPYKHLIPQWRDELMKWRFNDVIELHGEISDWEDVFTNLSLSVKLGHKKRGLVVTTHDTLSNPKFAEVARRSDFPMMLIVDEVHAVGSPVRKERITDNYNFRLGLSATPTRYFDDEGTKFIVDYFGGIVYSLPIEKAVSMGILVPYEYFPRIVELSKDEFEEYVVLTKKYASIASAKDEQLASLQERFLFERAKLVESAAAKYDALADVLEGIPKVDHCLVFATERQIPGINRILDSRRVVHHNFTEMEDLSERTELLARFSKGDYGALVAIRCLDEGVDVPAAKSAIIMASTGNPRQFIQRRGRLLRTDAKSGKQRAQIWDFVVAAKLKPDPAGDYFHLERGILERQLKRVQEFSSTALNPRYTTLATTNIKLAYRLV
jgi:superfamily II DNA or RNA helicase